MRAKTDSTSFGIRQASWGNDRTALALVRERVFVDEQSVPLELEWDGADERAEHLLAFDADQRPIGTARVLASGQIGRMAVLAPWRGRGVGTALLREALRIALQPGRPQPFLHAQSSAYGFYLAQGFRPEGLELYEAGIPHRLMVFRSQP